MSGIGPRKKEIPPGDQHERLVCPECTYVAYDNPKIINVAVVTYQGKILLCRRAIEPRTGFWTLPGGFMENGETVQDGAKRETFEEAGANITVGPLLAVYHTPDKSKVVMIFRAEMTSPTIKAGIESLEAQLFDWKDIPWKELAFPMDFMGLQRYDQTKHLNDFQPEIAVLPFMKPPSPPAIKPPAPKGPKI